MRCRETDVGQDQSRSRRPAGTPATRSTGASASNGSQAAPVFAMAIWATSRSRAALHPEPGDFAGARARAEGGHGPSPPRGGRPRRRSAWCRCARKAGASGVAATVLAKISLKSSSRRKSGRSAPCRRAGNCETVPKAVWSSRASRSTVVWLIRSRRPFSPCDTAPRARRMRDCNLPVPALPGDAAVMSATFRMFRVPGVTRLRSRMARP